jgi:hypothetical protein
MGNQQLSYGYDIDDDCSDSANIDSGFDETSSSSSSSANTSTSSSLNDTTNSSILEKSFHDSSQSSPSPLPPLKTSTPLLSGDATLKKSFFVSSSSSNDAIVEEEERKIVKFNFTSETTNINQDEQDLIYSSSFMQSSAKKRVSLVKSKSIGISIMNANKKNVEFEETKKGEEDDDDESCSCEECLEFNSSFSVSLCVFFCLKLSFFPYKD